MPAAQNIPSNRHKGPRHAYFNKTKFQPYRHCTERKPDDSWYRAMSSLCCPRCTKKLQWKIDYAKYLPQERARKCNLCQQKNVSIAYHRICQDCSRRHIRCAKCQMDPTTANQTDFWQKQRHSDDDEEDDGENDEQPTVAKPAVAVVVPVERPVRESRDGGGDDESDEEEEADPAAGTSDVQPARRNAGFDDADDDDEELKSLKGLDVGLLRAQKRRIRAMEEAAERAEMRERERRTVVRQEIAAAGGGRGGARDNGLDSDEEEM
jgi:hypothetical protein